MSILKQISDNILTQDNQLTYQPLFCVFEKKRIIGLDPQYSDDIVWLSEYDDYGIETDEEKIKELNQFYDENFEEPDGWIRTSYIDVDVFVTACFTHKGAQEYIKSNGHNLKKPFIFITSAYRNNEIIHIRETIKRLNTIQEFAGDKIREMVNFITDEFKRLNPDKDDKWMEGFNWGSHETIKYLESSIDLEKAEAIKNAEDSIKKSKDTKEFYDRRIKRLDVWFRSEKLINTEMANEWFAIQANGFLINDKNG